jgi:hypothetical protein
VSCRYCELSEPLSRTRPGCHEIDYMGEVSYPECRKENNMRLMGNKATKVAHINKQGDACRFSEIKPENRVKLSSVEKAEDMGYRPCKLCFK